MKLSLFLGILFIGALGYAKSSHFIVEISGLKFNPSAVEVRVGDIVTWKNEDIFPHTATSKGVFDSRTILPGKSFKIRFKKVEQVDYACTFHPIMKGTVTVKK